MRHFIYGGVLSLSIFFSSLALGGNAQGSLEKSLEYEKSSSDLAGDDKLSRISKDLLREVLVFSDLVTYHKLKRVSRTFHLTAEEFSLYQVLMHNKHLPLTPSFSPQNQADSSTWNVAARFIKKLCGVWQVRSVYFSPDGSKVVTQFADGHSYKGEAIVWDMLTRGGVYTVGGFETSSPPEFSRDGRWVMAKILAFANDGLVVWDASTGNAWRILSTDWVRSTQFSPSGDRILTTGKEGTILWDTANGDRILVYTDRATFAVFSPDGCKFLTQDCEGTFVLDTKTGFGMSKLQTPTGWYFFKFMFSPDGSKVCAISSANGILILFDVATGVPVRELRRLWGSIHAQFSQDGRRILATSWAATVVWDVETGGVRKLERIGPSQFSLNGNRILSPDPRGVSVWDATDLTFLFNLPGPSTAGNSDFLEGVGRFSPDGKQILTFSDSNSVVIWSSDTGKPIYTLRGHTQKVISAEFSPDSNQVVTASRDGRTILWNIRYLKPQLLSNPGVEQEDRSVENIERVPEVRIDID